MPNDFQTAWTRKPKALKVFDAFSPRLWRENIKCMIAAMREVTRKRRIAQAIEWWGVGKRRNWTYANG